jgi:branched-chain amino acid transport system permease protein
MLVAFTWSGFAQQIVSGLSTGGIYASLALAIVIIYRSTRVINFAQGEMATFSTFIAWELINQGVNIWAAYFLTLGISFVGGVLLERTVIRPVENAPVLTIVMVTIGLLILINGATFWKWGGATRAFPTAKHAYVFSTRPIHVGGVAFSIQDLAFIGVSLGAVALLYLLFQFTKVGLAMRATAVNPASSRLVGIRVGWMLSLGWGIGAALGALAGMMTAPTSQLDPNMMRGVLLYAFAAAILGGLESPIGAVVGGLALGVILNILGTYTTFFAGDMRLVGGFAIILVVLVFRPAGLFGRTVARKV